VPLKTQVLEHGRVLSIPTEQQLRSLLRLRAEEIRKRSGFHYHSSPTNIGVYVYETAEQAKIGQFLWMGMLFWRPEDGSPQITRNQEILSSAGQAAVERFGLSEEKRKEIYAASVRAEDRGQAEAERKRPVNATSTLADLTAQTRLAYRLQEKHAHELAHLYGVTTEVMDSIAVEAYTRGWPQPPLK